MDRDSVIQTKNPWHTRATDLKIHRYMHQITLFLYWEGETPSY